MQQTLICEHGLLTNTRKWLKAKKIIFWLMYLKIPGADFVSECFPLCWLHPQIASLRVWPSSHPLLVAPGFPWHDPPSQQASEKTEFFSSVKVLESDAQPEPITVVRKGEDRLCWLTRFGHVGRKRGEPPGLTFKEEWFPKADWRCS